MERRSSSGKSGSPGKHFAGCGKSLLSANARPRKKKNSGSFIRNITLHNTVVTDNCGVHSPQLDRRDSKSD
jgi:hypothetical protein